MNLLAVFLYVVSIFQTGLDKSVSDQVNSYLDNISKKENLSENYWAINDLYESTCSINNSVIRIIINSDNNELKSFFSKFPCGSSEYQKLENSLNRINTIALKYGLIDLFIYYTLNEPDIQKRSINYSIFIENGNPGGC